VFKHNNKAKTKIDIVEAFNIWNLLDTRYISILNHQFLSNLVHDRDLLVLLDNHIKHFQAQAKDLEDEAIKYKVKAPSRTPVQIRFSTQVDQISDKFIFDLIITEMRAELYALKRAVTSTTTNDYLRNIITKHMLDHINDYKIFFKYGKFKGWTKIVPIYRES
jgi:hypothetical protein